MQAAPFCPQRLNKVYIIGSTFATHIGGFELLGRPLINVLVFAHGPPTRWTSPAHGIVDKVNKFITKQRREIAKIKV